MANFSTQPAEKAALQQLDIEAAGLRPAKLPRHSRAGGVDHIGFNPPRPQPPRQPEAVAARFERDRDPLDFLSRLDRFIPPAQQHQRSSEYALFSERGDNGGIDHVNLPFSTVLRRSGL
jgi:hypothetical protein